MLRAAGATVVLTRSGNDGVGPCIDRRLSLIRTNFQCQLSVSPNGKRFRWSALEKLRARRGQKNDDPPSPQYRADAVEPALRCDDAVRPALPVSGRRLENEVSHAWRRAGIGRPARKQKRAEARSIHA